MTAMESSTFDEHYLRAWHHVKDTPGVLRNTACEAWQRRVVGPSKRVLQYNPEHIKTKRPPSTPTTADRISVTQPFYPEKFNFLKCGQQEVIVKVAVNIETGEVIVTYVADKESSATPIAAGFREHTWFINVNPLLLGHGLLTPFVEDCLPQVVTRECVLVALLIGGFSSRRDFRIGFNSLGAWASVNHYHWHTFYTSEVFEDCKMPIEAVKRRMLAQVDRGASDRGFTITVEDLVGWAPQGFVVSIVMRKDGDDIGVSERRCLADLVSAFVDKLLQSDIAHNLLIGEGGQSVYVIPRQKQRGGGAAANELAIALAESCGLGIVYTQEDFTSVDETMYTSIAAEYSLPPEEYDVYRVMWPSLLKMV